MMNPRRMSTRRTVQLMVILTLLAWATQTLFKQWGYGAVIVVPSSLTRPATAPATVAATAPATAPAAGRSVVLELRSEIRPQPRATVRLRDVCRWSAADADVVDAHADVALAMLSDASSPRRLSVADVRAALHDAGVNLSGIRFSGAATCTIAVDGEDATAPNSTVAKNETAEQHPVENETVAESEPIVEYAPLTTQPAQEAAQPVLAAGPEIPLRDLLVPPLLEKLALSEKEVQIDFDAKSQTVLKLTSPRCQFQIDDSRAADLGVVAWLVTIRDDAGERLVAVTATVRAWEEQLVLTRPLSKGQFVFPRDLASRRVLVEERQASPMTDPAEAIGQLAARDLKAGEMATPRDFVPPPVVNKGDFINVSMKVGHASVATVARAMESGAKGAVIQAKNEATRDVYRVVVTGASAGDVIAE